MASCLSALLASSLVLPTFGIAYADGADAVAVGADAIAPAFRGADVVMSYLQGTSIPGLDDLDRIDFEALAQWDAVVCKRLEDLRSRLREELEATPPASADPDPASPASPATPDEGMGDMVEDPFLGDGDSESISGSGIAAEEEGGVGTMGAASDVVEDEVPSTESDPFDSAGIYPAWSYEGDASFAMTRYTEDMTTQKFIAVVGEQARQVAQEYGISASEMIALAVVESFSGTHYRAEAPYRNLFGSVAYEAHEVRDYDEFGIPSPGGSRMVYSFSDRLCEYPTYLACLRDHAYRVANGIESALPDDGTWGGPDGTLTQRVERVIEDYDLARYDEPLELGLAFASVPSEGAEGDDASAALALTLTDLVAEATAHLGTPYVWGGATPGGFDCSGLVQYSYANAISMAIPRTTYYQCTCGIDVDFADLRMGDLLFFVKNGVCGHVGMYLGEGCYLEAPHAGAEVRVTTMDEKRPAFAKRLIIEA